MPENEAMSGTSAIELDLDPRTASLPILWHLLEWLVDNAEGHSTVLAWISDRSDDEGGFLWLMGQLGCRPRVMESAIRIIVSTPAQHRSGFRERLRWARKHHNGNETTKAGR